MLSEIKIIEQEIQERKKKTQKLVVHLEGTRAFESKFSCLFVFFLGNQVPFHCDKVILLLGLMIQQKINTDYCN